MKENVRQIQFLNRQNPKSHFDILKIENLLKRNDMDHSPDQLHRVEFYIIILIENGSGAHTIDFTEYNCQKGTLLTIRKDQLHKFHKSDFFEGKLLIFTDNFLISYLEESEALKTIILFNELLGIPKIELDQETFTQIQECIHRIENEYLRIGDEHSMGIIRSELHILIILLYRVKSHNTNSLYENRYIKDFMAFQELVENNVTQTTKVKDFALQLGISTKTLNTVTKSIVHKSAKEFIDEICTKQIKRLLINTKLSIKEVAYQSGFEETTNFFKYFKRHTHLTPEQYRASL